MLSATVNATKSAKTAQNCQNLIGHLTNYGQKAYLWTFWIFSHGGMSWQAVEISRFRLTRRAADCLKIENFNYFKNRILNLKIYFYSQNNIIF
jgi:hypothetical protein